MSITIDATVSGTSSNSYATLAEATAYFEVYQRFYSTWTGLTTAQQNAWLVQSCKAIDRMSFVDEKYYDTQALEFPKTITDQSTDAGDMPQKVKDAQCEMIMWLYQRTSSTDGSPDRTPNEIGLGKGSISLKYPEYAETNRALAGGYPESVRSLLRTWLKSSHNIEISRA